MTSQDSLDLRPALTLVPNAVVAVAAIVDSNPEILIIGTFVEISLDPPIVAIAVQNTSRTWPKLKNANSLGISVLSAEHVDAVGQLSSKTADRFAGIPWTQNAAGAVFLKNASAQFSVNLESEIQVGDHSVVFLKVTEFEITDNAPLVNYKGLLKPAGS